MNLYGMNWDILVHATNLKAVKAIAKNKALIPNPKTKQYDDALPFVYTTYHFGGVDTRTVDPFWSFGREVVLCISTTALRDFPFSACNLMTFGKCDPTIMSRPGKMSRKPNMSRLQNHINKTLMERFLKKLSTYYYSTHEIIFPEAIPTSYIVGAIVRDEQTQARVQKYLPGIKVVSIEDIPFAYTSYGCGIQPLLKRLAR